MKRLKIIDKSKPIKRRPLVRVMKHAALGLTLKNIDFDKENEAEVRSFSKLYRIPAEARCKVDGDPTNQGLSSAQIYQGHLPDMLFAVYFEDALIGSFGVSRIKVLEILPGEVRVSAICLPALPDIGSDLWFTRVVGIMQYALDNNFPTEAEGVILNIVKWELFEGCDELFKSIAVKGGAHKAFNFEASHLQLEETGETLETGKKILYMGRSSEERESGKRERDLGKRKK